MFDLGANDTPAPAHLEWTADRRDVSAALEHESASEAEDDEGDVWHGDFGAHVPADWKRQRAIERAVARERALEHQRWRELLDCGGDARTLARWARLGGGDVDDPGANVQPDTPGVDVPTLLPEPAAAHVDAETAASAPTDAVSARRVATAAVTMAPPNVFVLHAASGHFSRVLKAVLARYGFQVPRGVPLLRAAPREHGPRSC